MRTALRSATPMDFLLATLVWVVGLTLFAFGDQPADPLPANNQPRAEQAPAPRGAFNAQEQQERKAVWNSPEMLDARAWLAEYFRTSRAATPQQEKAYTERLSQLSADEMRSWLLDMRQHRMRLSQQNRSAAQQRQFSLSRASDPPPRNYVLRPTASYRPPNYVEPLSARRAAEAGLVEQRRNDEQRYVPLRSFEMLYYLDLLDIRDSLRELQGQGGP